MNKLLFILVVLVLSISASAQNTNQTNTIDSLIMRLSVLEQTTEKADVLILIADEYGSTDCELAKEYTELALALSKKIVYKKGELEAKTKLGEYLLFCDLNAFVALDYFKEAMKLAIYLDDIDMEFRILSNTAYAHYRLEDLDLSIKYYSKAADLAKKLKKVEELMILYGYLGGVMVDKGDTLKGLGYYETIFSFESKTQFKETNYTTLLIISDYFSLKKEYENAESFALSALNILENKSNYAWLSYANYNCGKIKLNRGRIEEAIFFGNIGVSIAEERKLNNNRLDNYKLLIDAYDVKNDFENKVLYLEKFYSLKDSIHKQEVLNRRQQYQTKLDNTFEQKEIEKSKGELRAKELKSKNDQLLIYAVTIGLIITFIFLFLLYRRLLKGNKLNKQLKEQQNQLQKLSIVAANISQMVMIVGNDDRIEWVNSAFEKKFGFLKFEAVNRTPFELLGGEDRKDYKKVLDMNKRIFDEKLAFEAVLAQYSKDNTAFLTHLHISPILNKKGDLERYIVISHDITEDQKTSEELKELSLVASNTTNAIVIFDAEMCVIWVNNSFAQISGLTTKSVLGKSPIDIYNGPLLTNQEKEALLNRYKKQEPFTIEIESTNRLTNLTFWISMNVTPVFDEDGILLKYISVATDITEVKGLKEQYGTLVETSTDMIHEIDAKGHFVFVNNVMSTSLGYSKEELKNTYYLDLVIEEHKERVSKFYIDQIESKKTLSYIEFAVKTRNNDLIWLGQSARLKLDHEGKFVQGFNLVSRDVSSQKKVEDKLKKTYSNASLLSEIGIQITSTRSVIEIINKVYGNINKLMEANVFGIALADKDNKRLVFPEIIENGIGLKNFGFELDDLTRLATVCYLGSKEIVIDDIYKQISDYVEGAELMSPVAGEQTISVIYLPLILKGKTTGVITVQSFKPNAYDEYQVNLIKSLAIFVAIAMENANLYETMEEKIATRTKEVRVQKEELEINYSNTKLLSEIGQLISTTLNLDLIFDELAGKVGQLMSADIFGVVIYDKASELIHYSHAVENGKRYKPFSVSMEESDNYAVWCVKNRKEIIINDNINEHQKYLEINVESLPKENSPQSLIFYPMIVENKLIGVITIQSFQLNAYQEYHLNILKTLASYIGTSIDNASLYDTLENKVQERTVELEQKNNDITASINYAKRLQKGILPDKSFMRQLLPDSFVYFKPKDIVSGDFYWVDRTQSKIFFAVVDCTGHGVPGAMMSIIGRNLLDQAVNEKGLTVPSLILNFLQVGLSLAFGQTGEQKTNLYDGMDLALCSIDLKTKILEFAGANNSLYLIQEGELLAIKGDKVAISAEYEVSNSYTNLEIEIEKGDVIYLTSDGFPDQFGGPKYKKFTYRKMQDVFMNIHKKDMSDQYDLIKKEINDWKGDKDQIDDICIMGIRIQ